MNRSELQCPGYPTNYECEALLANGAIIGIRPIRPDDASGLTEFHDHLSSESIHRRFFSAHPHLRPQEVERFTCVDYHDRLALVVETDEGLAAVARYDRVPGTDSAEVAFVVADALHGQGVGTLLLEHLAVAGRRAGVARFFAETLAYNHPMVQLFNQSGFACTSRTSQGVIDLSFSIAPTQRYLDHLTDRHFHAVHAWLAPAPAPAAGGPQVGVICGASPERSTLAAICRGDQIATSRVIGPAASDRPNQTDLLAYFALDPGTQVVALELVDVAHERRFVATARRLSEHKPVIALLALDAVCPSSLVDLCEQSGVEIVHEAASLGPRLGQLLAAVVAGIWRPIGRGTLPELDGYDVGRAHAALREQSNNHTGTAPLAGSARRVLGPNATQAVLAAYGLSTGVAPTPDMPARTPGVALGLRVSVGDNGHGGLAARITSSHVAAGSPMSRALPLTDRDAQELVRAAAPLCTDPAPLVDRVVRAARLVDDQAEVSSLNLPLMAEGTDQPLVWLGPSRSTDDDPFLSRLVELPPAHDDRPPVNKGTP